MNQKTTTQRDATPRPARHTCISVSLGAHRDWITARGQIPKHRRYRRFSAHLLQPATGPPPSRIAAPELIDERTACRKSLVGFSAKPHMKNQAFTKATCETDPCSPSSAGLEHPDSESHCLGHDRASSASRFQSTKHHTPIQCPDLTWILPTRSWLLNPFVADFGLSMNRRPKCLAPPLGIADARFQHGFSRYSKARYQATNVG